MGDYETIQKERDERKAAAKAARDEARAKLLEKLNELEIANGDDNVRGIWVADQLVVVRRPKQSEWNSFSDKSQVGGEDKQEHSHRLRTSLETLGRQCLLYPDEVAYRELCKVHPGTAQDAGIQAKMMADDAEVITQGKS